MALKIEGVTIINDNKDASLRNVEVTGAANAGSLVVYGNAALSTLTINGSATGPTASLGTNTAQLATTAFVQSAVATAAQVDSPAFTGAPTAPTPATNSNNTQIATTSFVHTITDVLAPRESPILTGTPTTPTPAPGANDGQVANTAFVISSIAANAPTKSGNGAFGTWNINTTGVAERANRTTWGGVDDKPTTIAGYTGSDAKDANPASRLGSGFYQNTPTTTANGWPENGGWWHLLSNTHSNGGNYYAQQFASDFNSNKLYYRSTANNGQGAWARVVLSDSGTYSMNTTGSAASLGGIAASQYALKDSPTLVGSPTTPTAAAGANNAQIANTAFVQNAISGWMPGNSGGIWNNGGGFIMSTTLGTGYEKAIQVREVYGFGGNNRSDAAPRLGFHWAGLVASSISMGSDGAFYLNNNPGTARESLYLANLNASGTVNAANITVNGQQVLHSGNAAALLKASGGDFVISNPSSPKACDLRISGENAQIYSGSKWETFISGINAYTYTLTSSSNNVDLRALAVQSGWDQVKKLVIIIPAGVTVGSAGPGSAAAVITGSFPNGVLLRNNGLIVGAGGAGGSAVVYDSNLNVTRNYTAPTAGGIALLSNAVCTIENNGIIGGGGGGGGAGTTGATWSGGGAGDGGGGGGGGGAGSYAGSGGYGGVSWWAQATGANGTNGSIYPSPSGAGGGGGAGSPTVGVNEYTAGRGANGGAGGALGSAGSGSESLGGSNAGAAPGSAIHGIGNVTFALRGTILGPMT
ncbi:hypothetical protein UFOVP116_17 [uncultured Caudovirales phage]|uniref:Tail fiber protein n=1 Tax=uncultured Caudovirales phage TaxID=2100421 RepID=A0A6J5L9H1_9CAUD|nr:hypothetical protein UFOVP116_17 [uncultured Caudovirales phage]